MEIRDIIQAVDKRRPEGPFAVNILRHRFPEILNALNWAEDQRYKFSLEDCFECRPDLLTTYGYPRCNYNVMTASMAVTFTPSPLHEVISSTILYKMHSKIDTYPIAARKHILTRSNEDVTTLEESMRGHKRLRILIKNQGS